MQPDRVQRSGSGSAHAGAEIDKCAAGNVGGTEVPTRGRTGRGSVMKRVLFGLVATFSAFHATKASAQTETFATYVSTCKTQLGFTDAQVAAIATNLNCNSATVFAPNPGSSAVNDYMGYARINDSVDLAFACRWLDLGSVPIEIEQVTAL
jgi:hypothetical protein